MNFVSLLFITSPIPSYSQIRLAVVGGFVMLLLHQQAGADLKGEENGSEDATSKQFAFQRAGFGLALVWLHQVSTHQQLQ